MKSIKLFKAFGIPLELHYTFILFFGAWLLITALINFASLAGTVVLLLIVFSSVVLHELSHSVVALSKGVKVQKIILFPIGGVALTKNQPKKTFDEFLISIAGPLFNFIVVFGIALLVSFVSNVPFWPYELFALNDPVLLAEQFDSVIMNYPLFALLWVNLLLGSFNLFVPALPMDGGRILRSLLAGIFPFQKATKIASSVSKAIAVAMAIIGFLFGHIFLIIIAAFVFLAATGENQSVEIQSLLGKKSVESAVKPIKKILLPEISLIEAVNELNALNENSLLVQLDEFNFAEFNSRNALNERNLSKTVKDLAVKVPNISVKAKAAEAFNFFASNSATILPVFDENKKLIGELRETELKKFLALSEMNQRIKGN
ncbi:MAG: M50 family metallopeptidase [Candidatus Diapherotrites archaeon]